MLEHMSSKMLNACLEERNFEQEEFTKGQNSLCGFQGKQCRLHYLLLVLSSFLVF